MFRIVFYKSRSKFFQEVKKLAMKWDYLFVDGDLHIIEFDVKEVFEKWDFFNLLFWRTVDWKGSTFGYDNYDLHSHCEKTRMFYALQEAYKSWVCMSEMILRGVAPVYYFPESYEPIKQKAQDCGYLNRILDMVSIAKNREAYSDEFGHIEFEAPLRNSDFAGRAARREKNKLKEE